MIIKVCGLREAENIRDTEAIGADWMGFIFYPASPRYISQVPEYLPVKAKRVGVFVNESISIIKQKQKEFGLDIIQLHGGEKPEVCAQLKKEVNCLIIKAISVAGEADIKRTREYEGYADYLLFDTKCSEVGGSGRAFNHLWLKAYEGQLPFLISGGIGPENIEELKNFKHPLFAGIDLNSRFEVSPGIKDVRLLEKFVNEITH